MFRKTLFVSLVLLSLPALADTSLEPCINGDVSASGSFPSQEMEDQIMAYLDWKPGEPYYLFNVAWRDIGDAYPEN